MNSILFYKLKNKIKILPFFIGVFLLITDIQGVSAQEKDFVVVLDAGHGGKDPGKVGYKKYKEKDIALKIVLEIGKLLEKEKNIKVFYTRKTDIFIGLKERGKIANNANADLFLSVHCNAHSSQASGSETWVLGTHANHKNFEVVKAENSVIELEDNYKTTYKGFDPNSPESVIVISLIQEEYLDQSIQLASIIQQNFASKLKRIDRGVKQAGFVVLHQTYMPSVLVETGFITNKKEALFLGTKLGQQKFSQSIFESVIKYRNQLLLNTVSPDVVEKKVEKKEEKPKQQSVYKDVVFKVQIAAGKRLSTKSYNFKGIKNVERKKAGRLYKYYVGSTSNYSEIKKIHQNVKSKGYSSAFIVAFKKGKKVDLSSVLKKS